MRDQWVNFLITQVKQARLSGKSKVEAPTRKIVITWVFEAWTDIDVPTIVAGFAKIRALFVSRRLPVERRYEDQDEGLPIDLVDSLEQMNIIDRDVDEIESDVNIENNRGVKRGYVAPPQYRKPNTQIVS